MMTAMDNHSGVQRCEGADAHERAKGKNNNCHAHPEPKVNTLFGFFFCGRSKMNIPEKLDSREIGGK